MVLDASLKNQISNQKTFHGQAYGNSRESHYCTI